MKLILESPRNDKSCSRRKDLWDAKVSAKDGIYIVSKGKKNEHFISVRNGRIDNGDMPAIIYSRDRHTEYWVRGFPQTRSDGSPAIVSGSKTEYWESGQCVRIEDINVEVEVTKNGRI